MRALVLLLACAAAAAAPLHVYLVGGSFAAVGPATYANRDPLRASGCRPVYGAVFAWLCDVHTFPLLAVEPVVFHPESFESLQDFYEYYYDGN